MLKIKHWNTMNHCLFKAKDTKGAVGNTVDYSSLTLFLLSHLIFLILFLISKNSLAFPIELYYI